jgi:hypothetical protein
MATGNHLDVFWVGDDGQLWSQWWDGAPGNSWGNHAPFPISTNFPVKAGLQSGVTAVARTPNHLDVFWVGDDGQLWTQWWDQAPGNSWADHAPFPISTNFPVKAGLHSGVTAVARDSIPWTPPPPPPPGQLDFNIPSITFDNGVPVGGNAHLTLWNNGNYVFSGHFHDSGATEYNMQLVIAVSDGAHAYTFEHQGHVSGTFESGSRDNDWNDTGTHPELVASWSNIAARNSWSWKADANSDLSNLVNAAVGILGTGLGIVAIVIA